MDVREKLVELLTDNLPRIGGLPKCDNPLQYTMDEIVERIADHLIAHGVTVQENCKACAEATQNCIVKLQEQIAELRSVQEWISVNDRLPEHGDVVLCFMKFGEQHILQWDNVSNWWLGYGHGDDWQKANVTHWCCLPQPPKGE